MPAGENKKEYDHDEISVTRASKNPVISQKEMPDENEKTKLTNPLINGKWGLTLQECRLVLALISSLQGDGSGLYSVRVKDLGSYMGLSEHNAYSVIATAAKKLQDRVFYYTSDSGDWVRAHWVASIEYRAKTSELIFEFSRRIEPLLIDMSKGYTKTSIRDLMKFMSFYSARLYLLCEEWCGIYKGKAIPKSVEIADLRDMFEIGDKYRTNRDFLQYVVNPAVKEINTYTDMEVKAAPVRVGRAFKNIEFVVQRKDKAIKTIDVAPAIPGYWSEDTRAMYNILIKIINDSNYVISILNDKSLDYVKANYKLAFDKNAKSPLKNFAGFLRIAIDSNYANYVDGAIPVVPPDKNAVKPPDPDSMPGAAKNVPPSPDSLPQTEKDAKKAEIKEKKEIDEELGGLTFPQQERKLKEIREAIKKEQDPEILGRYMYIVERDDTDFYDTEMRFDVARYIYRQRHPGVSPLDDAKFREPKVSQEVENAFSEINRKLASQMSMPK